MGIGKIIAALIIFSIIVVIHELGHFLLAKKNGIFVTEFSVGMGPRIATICKTKDGIRGGFFVSTKSMNEREGWQDVTKYSIKLLPLGGSCIMLGEDEIIEDEAAFNKKGVWARISVVFAGPFFNFILAFVLAMILVAYVGYQPSVISDVEAGMPMEKAGLKAGDEIIQINNSKINMTEDIAAYMTFHPMDGSKVDIRYVRDGQKYDASVTPVKTDMGYRLGFSYAGEYKKATPVEVVKYGFLECKYWVKVTVLSLKQMVLGKVSKDDIAGPVGIVNMVGDVIEETEQYGFMTMVMSLINMCILLSANLGVMNLLPIPALDGGRLVFLFIEVIRGKPVDQDKEGMVHFIGLVALMLLMVLVAYNDIMRIF
ncbi:MAG: RIP metalloprotease RseP [Lachnospiraceae bacterium]|nr:RIP metalloprotease RseP [Lachnospiraceae bacterium]